MTGAGVPAGAKIPVKVLGFVALHAELVERRHVRQERRARCASEMASGLDAALRVMWPIEAVSWSIIDSTWLPSRSVSAGPLPLYGTCSSFRSAMRISSSIARWFDEPLPAEAMLTPPGLFFASATNSA